MSVGSLRLWLLNPAANMPVEGDPASPPPPGREQREAPEGVRGLWASGDLTQGGVGIRGDSRPGQGGCLDWGGDEVEKEILGHISGSSTGQGEVSGCRTPPCHPGLSGHSVGPLAQRRFIPSFIRSCVPFIHSSDPHASDACSVAGLLGGTVVGRAA